MTDPIVARLLAALEALERTLEAQRECDRYCRGAFQPKRHSIACTERFDVRRRLAIAQRTQDGFAALYDHCYPHDAKSPRRDAALAAGVAVFASPGRDT